MYIIFENYEVMYTCSVINPFTWFEVFLYEEAKIY